MTIWQHRQTWQLFITAAFMPYTFNIVGIHNIGFFDTQFSFHVICNFVVDWLSFENWLCDWEQLRKYYWVLWYSARQFWNYASLALFKPPDICQNERNFILLSIILPTPTCWTWAIAIHAVALLIQSILSAITRRYWNILSQSRPLIEIDCCQKQIITFHFSSFSHKTIVSQLWLKKYIYWKLKHLYGWNLGQ